MCVPELRSLPEPVTKTLSWIMRAVSSTLPRGYLLLRVPKPSGLCRGISRRDLSSGSCTPRSRCRSAYTTVMQASGVATSSETLPGVTHNVWHQEQLVHYTSQVHAVDCLHMLAVSA